MMGNNITLPKGKGNFYAGVLAGEWIYCSMCNVNGLYRKNIKTGEQEYLGRFERYDSGMGVHEMAFISDNSIFFMPYDNTEKVIAVYDLDMKNIEYIDLPYSPTYIIGRIACKAIDAGDAIWVIPCVYDAILRVDKATHEIKRYDNWPSKIAEDGISKAKFSDAVLIDGKIYICPYDCSGIVIFDVATETMEMVEIEILNRVYRKMVFFKQKLYLFPENFDHDIVVFDINTGKIEKCLDKPKAVEGEYHAITCVDGRHVWMFPYEGAKIIKFDLESCRYDVSVFSMDQAKNKKIVSAKFWNVYETEDKALVSMGNTTSPYILVGKEELDYGTIELSTDEILHRLFNSIEERAVETNDCDVKEANIGSTIYNKIKG